MRRLTYFALALTLTNVSCSQESLDPAAVCASNETTSQIFADIEQNDLPAIGLASQIVSHGAITTDQVKRRVDDLIAQQKISMTSVTFEGKDNDASKISCKANVHIDFSGDDDTAIRVKNDIGNSDIPIAYTRQPSADGKSWVYSYSADDDVNQVVKLAWVQLMNEARTSRATVGPDATNAAPQGSTDAGTAIGAENTGLSSAANVGPAP